MGFYKDEPNANKFIKLTVKLTGRTIIINKDEISRIGIDHEGTTVIVIKPDWEYELVETIDQIWDQLKPQFIRIA